MRTGTRPAPVATFSVCIRYSRLPEASAVYLRQVDHQRARPVELARGGIVGVLQDGPYRDPGGSCGQPLATTRRHAGRDQHRALLPHLAQRDPGDDGKLHEEHDRMELGGHRSGRVRLSANKNTSV